MARITARDVSLYVGDSTGACRCISGRTNTATMTISSEAPEVTCYGASYRERLAGGLKDFELSIGGFYDGAISTACGAIDGILFPLLGVLTNIKYGPGGSTTACILYTGCVICNNYTVEGAVEGVVGYTATFQSAGSALTSGLWP